MEFFPWSGFKKRRVKKNVLLTHECISENYNVNFVMFLKWIKVKKIIVCLVHIIKIGVFIGKYDPVTKSLIKICLKPGWGACFLVDSGRSIG